MKESLNFFAGSNNLGLSPLSAATGAPLAPGSPGGAYFAPGGRHNMRRKSDCGDRGTHGGGGAEAGGLPDLAAFQVQRKTAELEPEN